MATRFQTGVKGLDEMIEGGFKENNSILVVGGCGSGKSTLGMQYLVKGAHIGENGVYVTFEEEPDQFRDNMLQHGWDLKKLEDAGKLRIIRVEPEDVYHIVKGEYGGIMDAIQSLNAKRVVIDSLTSIEMMIEGEFEKRQCILKLISWLRKSKCTSIMVAENEQDPNRYDRQGVLESLVDGVIVLYNLRRGKTRIRALEVLKMRGTNHMMNLVPYIMDKGITLQPHQVIFGDVGKEQCQ
ncbi:MAG: ATPase domain-containing protein [Candidatus Altiarchaeota archaeon]